MCIIEATQKSCFNVQWWQSIIWAYSSLVYDNSNITFPLTWPWRQSLFSSLLSLPNLLILLIIHLLFQAVLVASGQSFGLSLCQMTLATIAESAKRSKITSLKPWDHRYEWNINRYLFTLILVCVSVREPCYNLTKQILHIFYTPYIYLELFV